MHVKQRSQEPSTFIRWCGIAGMVGGLLHAVGSIVTFLSLLDANWRGGQPYHPLELAQVPGLLLLPVGLLGIHLSQHREYGPFGTAAAAVTLLGVLVGGGQIHTTNFRFPLVILGATLLGGAIARAGRLAAGAAWLLGRGLPLIFLSGVALGVLVPAPELHAVAFTAWVIVFDAGVAWLGYGVWTLRSRHSDPAVSADPRISGTSFAAAVAGIGVIIAAGSPYAAAYVLQLLLVAVVIGAVLVRSPTRRPVTR